MRLLWIGVLVTGFLVLAVATSEQRDGPGGQRSGVFTRAEDGTGFPKPYPSPSPSPSPSPTPRPKPKR